MIMRIKEKKVKIESNIKLNENIDYVIWFCFSFVFQISKIFAISVKVIPLFCIAHPYCAGSFLRH